MARSLLIALVHLACVALVCVCLSGCGKGKSFTEDDWKQVKSEMTEKEVEKVLGPPDRREQQTKTVDHAFWTRNGRLYKITYRDDKVQGLFNNPAE